MPVLPFWLRCSGVFSAAVSLPLAAPVAAEVLSYTASGGLISGRLYGLGGPQFSSATWTVTATADSADRIELPATAGSSTYAIPVVPMLTIDDGVSSWTLTLRNETDANGVALDWFVFSYQWGEAGQSQAGFMRWHPNLGYGYGAAMNFDVPQLSLMQPANVVAPFSFFSTTRFWSVDEVPIDIFGYTGGPGSFRIEAVPSPAGFVVAIGATLLRTRRRRI